MMHTLKIQGRDGLSRIIIGERLQNLERYLPNFRPIIITDPNIEKHYEKQLPGEARIVIGTGEAIKTLDTVKDIYARLIKLGADRSHFLVGIGGGIVCDITGFVASTYMRGLRFGFVATTLLAQVDAGVGGKNGVNFNGYKNMVGVFHQPEFVICDPHVLKTLPKKELSCGLAEVVKHAAIADVSLMDFIESHHKRILTADSEVLEALVYASVKIKAAIVARDEREFGDRRRLNFGHTFGHAVEKLTGLPHGDAVSIGMAIAASLSVIKGYLRKDEAGRLLRLLDLLELPTSIHINSSQLVHALKKDKKKEGDTVHFVFLNAIGKGVVEQISFKTLERLLGKISGKSRA